jgi:hypothetical protein
MNVGTFVEIEILLETDVLEENMLRCQFVYHKFHNISPELNPNLRNEKLASV